MRRRASSRADWNTRTGHAPADGAWRRVVGYTVPVRIAVYYDRVRHDRVGAAFAEWRWIRPLELWFERTDVAGGLGAVVQHGGEQELGVGHVTGTLVPHISAAQVVAAGVSPIVRGEQTPSAP